MIRSLYLIVGCVILGGSIEDSIAQNNDSASLTTQKASKDNPSVAFADWKYAEIGKKNLNTLAKGSMDSWAENYADNVRYFWNGGDSLVGKSAVEKFWRERRASVIESMTYKNDIWLPIQINKPQATEQPGVWLLSWYEITAKYKGGSTMTQWMHMDYHFDANGKIDQVVQYVDRVPILAALPKK